ncbi:MAG: hypothetical protein ACTIK9_08115 [Agrococcus casei]|uniref:hypothetical protein n=1 Tax=Agrococcus casei TaxID=343512 RepID=UPI003F9E99AF
MKISKKDWDGSPGSLMAEFGYSVWSAWYIAIALGFITSHSGIVTVSGVSDGVADSVGASLTDGDASGDSVVEQAEVSSSAASSAPTTIG